MNKTLFVYAFGTFATFATWTVTAAPTVYLPLGTANEILVVDAATGKTTSRIGDVVNPHGLAVTPDGKYLIVGSSSEAQPGQAKPPPKPAGMSEEEHKRHHSAPAAGASNGPGMSHVSLIDRASGRVLQRFDVRGAVHHNAVTPDGRYAISTHTTAGGISVIDLSARKLIKTVATGPLPNYALVTKDGKRVYVSNAGNNTISVIDTEHWIVTHNILAGFAPEHMAFTPDETTLYANNVGDGTVSVISLKQGKQVKRLKVGNDPHGIAVSSDGKTLFVAARKDNKLVRVDLISGKKHYLDLAPAPYHVADIGKTGKLYVSSRKQPLIWVVDQKSFKVSGTIKLPGGEGHQTVVVN